MSDQSKSPFIPGLKLAVVRYNPRRNVSSTPVVIDKVFKTGHFTIVNSHGSRTIYRPECSRFRDEFKWIAVRTGKYVGNGYHLEPWTDAIDAELAAERHAVDVGVRLQRIIGVLEDALKYDGRCKGIEDVLDAVETSEWFAKQQRKA